MQTITRRHPGPAWLTGRCQPVGSWSRCDGKSLGQRGAECPTWRVKHYSGTYYTRDQYNAYDAGYSSDRYPEFHDGGRWCLAIDHSDYFLYPAPGTGEKVSCS